MSPIPFWKSLVLALCAMQIGLVLTMVTGYQLHWSGANSWVALGIAALISCLIAAAISYVSRQSVGTGSLLSYVQGVLPHWAVCVVAAALLLGYIIGPATMTMWAAAYVSSILMQLGVEAAGTPLGVSLLVVMVAALAGYCAYRGLELSARVSLALGLIAFPVAAGVTILATVRHGVIIDYPAALSGMSGIDLGRGAFIAMGFFVGFDGVCALANGTADPARNVPRLLAWTVVLIGLTDVLGALFQTPVLLAHLADLEAGRTPTYVLLQASGLESIYVLFDATLCMAQLAGIIAWLNISALIIATAARDGFLPRALGQVHAVTGSPYVAILLLAVLGAFVPSALQAIAPNTLLVSMTYLTNGLVMYWVVAYILVCVAAMLLHHRRRIKPRGIYFASLGAIVALVIVLVIQATHPFDAVSAYSNHLAVGLLLCATLALVAATRHRRNALTLAA